MACEDGCPTHKFPSNRTPTGNDDPCNTSGEGEFCPGSYWLYDPTEPGAVTAVDGDCPRLFIRAGEDCGVDQWVEIAVAELITDTVDPVNGTDCCPPGTLWRNTVNGRTFTSVNDAGNCEWCQIMCGDGFIDHQIASFPTVLVAAPLPAVPTNTEPPIFIVVNNPTTMTMFSTLFVDGLQVNSSNSDPAPAVATSILEWSDDGGGSWNFTSPRHTTHFYAPAGSQGDFAEFNNVGISVTFEIPPGGSVTWGVRRRHEGNPFPAGVFFHDSMLINVLSIALPS